MARIISDLGFPSSLKLTYPSDNFRIKLSIIKFIIFDPVIDAMTDPEVTANKTWPQYVVVSTALIAIFCSGIHLGWPGPSLPRLFSDEYPFDISAEDASYITIIGPAGDILGNILSSVLVDLIGRKITVLLIGLPQLVSMTMIYLSNRSVALLYAARFIGGISEGACFTVLPIYICEVSEPRIRGVLGSSFSLVLIVGVLFVNVVGSYNTIYTSAFIFFNCSLVFLVLFSFMPESPYFLVMRNQLEKARTSLAKLRDSGDVDAELAALVVDVERQMSEKGTFADLWRIRSNRMAVIILTLLRFLQQFSGVTSFTFYAQILFGNATQAVPRHWAAIIMIAIQAVFTLASVFVVDLVGRKPLVLLSIAGCCVTLLFNGVYFLLRDLQYLAGGGVDVLPLLGMVVLIAFFALGLGSVVNLLLGELFPASVKAKASCLMNMVFALGMLLSTKFYQYTGDRFGLAVPFLVFGACQLVGFGFSARLMRETKNKTLEEIQQELKRM